MSEKRKKILRRASNYANFFITRVRVFRVTDIRVPVPTIFGTIDKHVLKIDWILSFFRKIVFLVCPNPHLKVQKIQFIKTRSILYTKIESILYVFCYISLPVGRSNFT